MELIHKINKDNVDRLDATISNFKKYQWNKCVNAQVEEFNSTCIAMMKWIKGQKP